MKDIFDKVTDGVQGGEVTYTVTVEGGSGSGEYAVGDTVNVVADVPEGQKFNSWTAEGVEIDDNTQDTLEFTMPENDVTLKATTYVISNDYEWVSSRWNGYEATNEEGKGYYKYVGNEKEVKIPHVINGHPMTNYYRMFYKSDVEKVISDNPNVTNMDGMFYKSKATGLDLSSFDTSNVTDMMDMFYYSSATSLDLSSFDTSKVTDMRDMFYISSAKSLDLSSFDMNNVINMGDMFQYSSAKTGYARTQTDADKFNKSSNKPSDLTFTVK